MSQQQYYPPQQPQQAYQYPQQVRSLKHCYCASDHTTTHGLQVYALFTECRYCPMTFLHGSQLTRQGYPQQGYAQQGPPQQYYPAQQQPMYVQQQPQQSGG